MEEVQLSLKFEWKTIESAPGKPYAYPESVTDYLRNHWKRPAMYRWCLEGTTPTCFIGETDDLAKCIYQFCNPSSSQKTFARVKGHFTSETLFGNTIHLEVLQMHNFQLNGEVLTKSFIEQQANRKILENLLVAYYQHKGDTLLNMEKKPGDALRNLF